jgi:transketolase
MKAKQSNFNFFGGEQVNSLMMTSKKLRRRILNVATGKGGHIGGSFSAVDIILTLYKNVLNIDLEDPKWPERDRFILSKGHCSLALYAVLEEIGFLEPGELDNYTLKGSRLAGHAEHFEIPAIEMTTGSLGHGISCAAGMALAAKISGKNWKVFCVVGDGECNEGSVWETLLFAAQQNLKNLIIIVDNNKMESLDLTKNILSIEPLAEKFTSFNFEVREIDGHNFEEIFLALTTQPKFDKPVIIVANTVKGKGVSFMENTPMWHYRAPNEAELKNGLAELN